MIFYCLRVVLVARTLTICFLRHITRIEKVYPMRPWRKTRQLFLILSKRWMLQCCLQWLAIDKTLASYIAGTPATGFECTSHDE